MGCEKLVRSLPRNSTGFNGPRSQVVRWIIGRIQVKSDIVIFKEGAMTTPTERQYALLQAGALLKQLSNDASLPESLWREASRLLRHYPRRADLRFLGSVADLPLPSEVDQAELLQGYPLGPHDGP